MAYLMGLDAGKISLAAFAAVTLTKELTII